MKMSSTNFSFTLLPTELTEDPYSIALISVKTLMSRQFLYLALSCQKHSERIFWSILPLGSSYVIFVSVLSNAMFVHRTVMMPKR